VIQISIPGIGRFSSGLPFSVRRAARKFRGQRLNDYYDTLADKLEDVEGGSSMLKIFQDDAKRFAGSPRGVLAEYWAMRYQDRGASLAEAWTGSLPDEDVALIRAAQRGGTAAVIGALRDLARVGEVIRQAKQAFLASVATSLIGATVVVAFLLAIPFFLAPQIRFLLGDVTPDYWGSLTTRYFKFSEIVKISAPFIVLVIMGSVSWIAWALPHWTGNLRTKADDALTLFRLYRDFKGSMFLAMQASLTRNRDGSVTNQREALQILRDGATPWLRWKIDLILENITKTGGFDAKIFDVGVLDKEFYYLLEDLIAAKGLSLGLSKAGQRSEQKGVKTIARRAKFFSVVVLGLSLLSILGLSGWNYGVIKEIGASLQNFYTSR